MEEVQKTIQKLEEVLIPNGFYRAGDTFIKIQEKDIFCCIRFRENDVAHSFFDPMTYTLSNALELGLESLYSELPFDESDFDGYKPKYFVVNLIGESYPRKYLYRESYQDAEGRIIPKIYDYTVEEQLQILSEKGLPFIHDITSQEQLLRTMIKLEMVIRGFEDLLGLNKIAPLLYMRKYEEAGWIARNVLLHWGMPSTEWSNPEESIFTYKMKQFSIMKEQDRQTFNKLCQYIKLADNKNQEECQVYLQRNYEKNLKRIKNISNGRI